MKKWLLPTILLAVGCIFMAGISTGCTATSANPDVNQVAIDAAATIARIQADVDKFQLAADAISAQLKTLPANDPTRKTLEKQLADIQPTLTKAKLLLALAQIGVDVFVVPPVPPAPTTQAVK